ncbi:hypothetical protein K474DRAFT_1669190 [Panus rudis PR-1116 ss-1]|nr:hypothetical protein K474DRAFT_1669190 [Panus rudis PR-1116 ss-1]
MSEPRPASNVSMDTTIAAEEALDLFDDRGLSYRTSKVSDAIFGSSPRHRTVLDDVKHTPSRRDSPTLPWRRVSVDSANAGAASASTPRKPRRVASASAVKRPDSPDIETILAKTPRPRRSTSALFSSPTSTSKAGGTRSRSTLSLRAAIKSEKSQNGDTDSILDEDLLEKLENDSESDGVGGSESDSSIDIHTPLPHLMFRDGFLSPRSKLFPQDLLASMPYLDDNAGDRSRSVLSVASTVGSVKSGLQRDPRDTQRRRQRHRDGRLLKAGMGLTTGLGWSDSEDEDAPSMLTRQLIKTVLERKRSNSGAEEPPSRPTSLYSMSSSRFMSPTPSLAKPSLARKTPSANMRALAQSATRSASVSFPLAHFAGKESPRESVTRTRVDSTASRTRTDSSASLWSQSSGSTSGAAARTPTAESFPGNPLASESMSLPTLGEEGTRSPTPHASGRLASSNSAKPSGLPRQRAESSASVVSRLPSSSASKTRVPSSGLPRVRAASSASNFGFIHTRVNSSASVQSSASKSKMTLPASLSRRVDAMHQQDTEDTNPASTSESAIPRRDRAESTASTTTQSSSASHSKITAVPEASPFDSSTSLNSISSNDSSPNASISTHSSGSNNAVPRPLRLPQTAGIYAAARSLSLESLHSHTSSTSGEAGPSQRKRTLSGPRPLRPRSPSHTPQTQSSWESFDNIPQVERTVTYPLSTNEASSPSAQTVTYSPSHTPTASPGSSSPSSPRQRPTLIGARPRPQPRTGTGMAYRTSSFSNLSESALKIRPLTLGGSGGTDNGSGVSGYPVYGSGNVF